MLLSLFTLVSVAALMDISTTVSGLQTKMQSLNVAVVQYPLVGSLSTDDLITKVRGYIDSAKVEGSQLVMVPELFALDLVDFSKPVPPQLTHVTQLIFPTVIHQLRDLAIEYGIYLLAGSVPFETSSKKVRNRSYLFSPEGNSVFQEKVFLTPDEVEWGWESTSTVTIFDTPWGKTAIAICYDSEFPLISETITQQSIDLLLIPSMTGEEGFTRVRWAAQARAVEHMAYVLVTGTTGAPTEGWEMKAQGAVLGPSLPGFDPLIAEGELDMDGAIVFATLDFTKLAKAKAKGMYYPAQNEQNTTIQLASESL